MPVTCMHEQADAAALHRDAAQPSMSSCTMLLQSHTAAAKSSYITLISAVHPLSLSQSVPIFSSSTAMQDDSMARAANAAAAAAIGISEAGLNDLTTSERLEPASIPAEAEAMGHLHGLVESAQPGVHHKASAEPADNKEAGAHAQAASAAPSAAMQDDLRGSSTAAKASAAADAPSTADQAMHDASEPAHTSPAPVQDSEAHPELSQAGQPPEQMTQAYPAATQDMQPPEQVTQAYGAVPIEVEGGSLDERALHDVSGAQHAEQGSTAPDAQPLLRSDGKPLIAGSAIFTKVSPMKGKVHSPP